MGHPGPSHYGAAGPTHGLPLYPSMTPTQPQSAGSKRSRPDDLDLTVSGLTDLDQSDLESMQQTPMGSAYTHAPPPPGAPPTHHHHRLPDQGPPTKMMRRDGGDGALSSGGGGAPSVVGQVGMPAPAPRPRGPKLKFTPEDDQLLIDLKENKNLTWKQIADFFPGRSSGTLQVRYCTKLKAKTTQWTDETVRLILFLRFLSLLLQSNTPCRIKSFEPLWQTTRARSGASSRTRSALGSRPSPAENGLTSSWAAVVAVLWRATARTYSNQRLRQGFRLLGPGTPSTHNSSSSISISISPKESSFRDPAPCNRRMDSGNDR